MLRHLAWTCAGVAVVLMIFGGTAARAQWAGDIPGKRPWNGASYRVEVVSFEFLELEHS